MVKERENAEERDIGYIISFIVEWSSQQACKEIKKSVFSTVEGKKIDRHDLVLFYFPIFLPLHTSFFASSYIGFTYFRQRRILFFFACCCCCSCDDVIFYLYIHRYKVLIWLCLVAYLATNQQKHPINLYYLQ